MIRGGLRTRFIVDSVRLTVLAGLQELGWFDATIYDDPPGTRSHRPLHYIARPLRWDIPIEANKLAISAEDVTDEDFGLGGDVEDVVACYIDLYAEDDHVGWHLMQDIHAILLGKTNSVGRTGPVIDVYDLRMATPAPFTTVDVERVWIDRGLNELRDFMAHWFMARVDLSDEYLDEGSGALTTTDWAGLGSTWGWIQAVGP